MSKTQHHRNDHLRSSGINYYWFIRISALLIILIAVSQLYSTLDTDRSPRSYSSTPTQRRVTALNTDTTVGVGNGGGGGGISRRNGIGITSDGHWSFDEESHYVRCDVHPDIHMPTVDYKYQVPNQQSKCIDYPPPHPSYIALSKRLKIDEINKVKNGTDIQIFTVYHTVHNYHPNTVTTTAAATAAAAADGTSDAEIVHDYGGHLFVIHENCHANVSLADTHPDIAAQVNRRYGPTAFELRVIGPEMHVVPLAYVDPLDYNDRHHAMLARPSLRPPAMERTAQEENDEYLRNHPLTEWNMNNTIGKFCPSDAWSRHYGRGHFNERTCHLHGNDRCVYEAAYAVSLPGEYDVQAYMIYFDYEAVSNVQPRLRWPRSQNALFFHSTIRQLMATPQPWPRPKGYTDFLRYSPAPSPISSSTPLQLRERPFVFDNEAPITMIESSNSGRWVRKSDFHLLGITNGSVWWPRRYYWRPGAFFCQIADINDYYYVPFSYDHVQRMEQWKKSSSQGFRIVEQADLSRITSNDIALMADSHTEALHSNKPTYFSLYFHLLHYFTYMDLTSVSAEFAPILIPPDVNQLTRNIPLDFATMRRCLSGRRIAFSGDSQSRALVGYFLSVLAGADIILHKQKWKGVQLKWDCRTIALTDNPHPPNEVNPSSEATEFEELSTENVKLNENELKVCYIPLSDMHYSVDLMYQALIADFDLIMINAGQHPLSFETKQRSFPYFALWQRQALDGIRQRYYSHLKSVMHADGDPHNSKEEGHGEHVDSHRLHIGTKNIQKYASDMMSQRLMWWSIMPMPRSLIDRYFDKLDGDGRTSQRIEAANEAMKGVMREFGVTVYDQTESIHWPFIDCCQDSAHANEPTFHTIVADMFDLFHKQLNCSI